MTSFLGGGDGRSLHVCHRVELRNAPLLLLAGPVRDIMGCRVACAEKKGEEEEALNLFVSCNFLAAASPACARGFLWQYLYTQTEHSFGKTDERH